MGKIQEGTCEDEERNMRKCLVGGVDIMVSVDKSPTRTSQATATDAGTQRDTPPRQHPAVPWPRACAAAADWSTFLLCPSAYQYAHFHAKAVAGKRQTQHHGERGQMGGGRERPRQPVANSESSITYLALPGDRSGAASLTATAALVGAIGELASAASTVTCSSSTVSVQEGAGQEGSRWR